jgi:nucleoid-associated protein YgaU
MPLDNLFKLSKLTIAAYGTAERLSLWGVLEVQFNPETLSLKYENMLEKEPALGASSGEAKFAHGRSKTLAVDLVFDGTHVSNFGAEQLGHLPTVGERVESFLRLCYRVASAIHEPPYLKLTWNAGVLGPSFDCRLESVDVKYTAFDRDGSPLHAELAAVFIEDLDPKLRVKGDRLTSPDLTHRRTVHSGDTLPLLCRDIYGSAVHYLRVAEANRLDDFRQLQPGTELFFPPFEGRSGG